jgi:GNAT superfamily N-acetyltransferase
MSEGEFMDGQAGREPRQFEGHIREATPADADEIAALFGETRHTSLPFLPTRHTPEEDRAYFGDRVLPTCTVWVAEDADGRIVGFLALSEGHVEHLYVRPSNQRRGIGGALLARAKAASPGGLTLWAFQENVQALEFYAGHGFVPERFTDGMENEERRPDVLLRWTPDRV